MTRSVLTHVLLVWFNLSKILV